MISVSFLISNLSFPIFFDSYQLHLPSWLVLLMFIYSYFSVISHVCSLLFHSITSIVNLEDSLIIKDLALVLS